MTVDQRARESAAAIRAARAEAQFTSSPLPTRPRRRSRVALAAAGALAVLLMVGIPAALLLRGRNLDTLGGTAPAAPAPPAEQPVPADPTRSVRQPTTAELDSGIRYLRTYAVSSQDGIRFTFATEQWLHPGGESVARAAASPPRGPDGDLTIDVAAGDALLDSVEPVGDAVVDGARPFGFADRYLPRTPAELEAALTSGPLQGGPLFSPGEALTPDGSGLDRSGLILRTVPSAMSTVLDPEVAAAFYDLVSGLDGAVVRPGAADPLGRPAIEVAVPVPMFDDNGAEVGLLAYVTWFDTETKLVIGQRSELESGAFPFSGYEGPVARLFVIAERGVVDAMPPQPEPRPEPPTRQEPASPSTTVPGADVIARDGSAFASSQIDASGLDLMDLARGNLECAEDCRAIDEPRTVHLTLDPILQSELEPYLTADAFAGSDGAAALVMVMDSETGAVHALAGDADAVDRGIVDLAFTQQVAPGTALLPGTMVAAMSAGLGPDTPITPSDDCGSAAPMTMAEALEARAAPVFCQAAAQVGEDRIREVVNRTLGLPAGGQGLAVATGAEPASIARIAALYATLANDGRRPHPHMVDRIEAAGGDPLGTQLFDEHQAIDGQAAATVQALLDGAAGYAGASATGTWHAGSAGGITTVVWTEGKATQLPDVWATVMSLAGVGG